MRKYKKFLLINKKYGFKNLLVGIIRKSKNDKLIKKYNFATWHLTPIQFRPYALDIVDIVKKYLSDENVVPQIVVEIGCGLGDIIGSIKAKSNIGFDVSAEVLCGARELHPNVSFQKGSFEDVHVGRIGCLIMVNFIHELSPEEMDRKMDILLKNNSVVMFVIDTLDNISNTNYRYQHNGERMFGHYGYKRIYCSEKYETVENADRRIEVWIKYS